MIGKQEGATRFIPNILELSSTKPTRVVLLSQPGDKESTHATCNIAQTCESMYPTFQFDEHGSMHSGLRSNANSVRRLPGQMTGPLRNNAGTSSEIVDDINQTFQQSVPNTLAPHQGPITHRVITRNPQILQMRTPPPPPPTPPPLPSMLPPPLPPPLPAMYNYPQSAAVVSAPEVIDLESTTRSIVPGDALTYNGMPGYISYGYYAYTTPTQPQHSAPLRYLPALISPPPPPPLVPMSIEATQSQDVNCSSDGLDSLRQDPLVSRLVKSVRGVHYVRNRGDTRAARETSVTRIQKASDRSNLNVQSSKNVAETINKSAVEVQRATSNRREGLMRDDQDVGNVRPVVSANEEHPRKNKVEGRAVQQFRSDATAKSISSASEKVSPCSSDRKGQIRRDSQQPPTTLVVEEKGSQSGRGVDETQAPDSVINTGVATKFGKRLSRKQVYKRYFNPTVLNLNDARKSKGSQNQQNGHEISRVFKTPSVPFTHPNPSNSDSPPSVSTPSARIALFKNTVPDRRSSPKPSSPRHMKRRRSLSLRHSNSRLDSSRSCDKSPRRENPPHSVSLHERQRSEDVNSPVAVDGPSTGCDGYSDDANVGIYSDYSSPEQKAVAFCGSMRGGEETPLAANSMEDIEEVHVGTLDMLKAHSYGSPYTSDAYSASPGGLAGNSGVSSEHDAPSHHEHDQEHITKDPDFSYPEVSRDFCGIPSTSVPDLLQVWDFVSNFCKSLKVTPFPLYHLEKAVVHGARCSILDTCILRLVRTAMSDPGLVADLGVADNVVRAVQSGAQKPYTAVSTVLAHLPQLLQFESPDFDADGDFLQKTVSILSKGGKGAFFDKIDAAGRLRVLRELVDYACMADVLRECVTDSLEHVEEEKKKAREEFTANRKRIEAQIRQLRQRVIDHKDKHGLTDQTEEGATATESAVVSTDRLANTSGVSGFSGNHENREHLQDQDLNPRNSYHKDTVLEHVDGPEAKTSSPITLSRKEKRLQSAMEQQERDNRKNAIRELDSLEDQLERARANLRALKKSRIILYTRELNSGHDNGLDGTSEMNKATGGAGNGTPVRMRRKFAVEEPEDPVRTHALGCDRDGRRYWFLDGCGRVWIEDSLSNEWCALVTVESVHDLLKWLNPMRENEQALHANITHRLQDISNEMKSESWLKSSEKRSRVHPTRSQKKVNKGGPASSASNFLNYRNTER